jgi:hypothetical protein
MLFSRGPQRRNCVISSLNLASCTPHNKRYAYKISICLSASSDTKRYCVWVELKYALFYQIEADVYRTTQASDRGLECNKQKQRNYVRECALREKENCFVL